MSANPFPHRLILEEKMHLWEEGKTMEFSKIYMSYMI